jgi:hypothetical protein
MILVIALQLIAVATGFASVVYWWRSATLKPVEAPTTAATPTGGFGDQFAEIEGGKNHPLEIFRTVETECQGCRVDRGFDIPAGTELIVEKMN